MIEDSLNVQGKITWSEYEAQCRKHSAEFGPGLLFDHKANAELVADHMVAGFHRARALRTRIHSELQSKNHQTPQRVALFGPLGSPWREADLEESQMKGSQRGQKSSADAREPSHSVIRVTTTPRTQHTQQSMQHAQPSPVFPETPPLYSSQAPQSANLSQAPRNIQSMSRSSARCASTPVFGYSTDISSNRGTGTALIPEDFADILSVRGTVVGIHPTTTLATTPPPGTAFLTPSGQFAFATPPFGSTPSAVQGTGVALIAIDSAPVPRTRANGTPELQRVDQRQTIFGDVIQGLKETAKATKTDPRWGIRDMEKRNTHLEAYCKELEIRNNQLLLHLSGRPPDYKPRPQPQTPKHYDW